MDRMLGLQGYSHAGLVVDDLAAARAFYVDVLGLEELPRPDLGVPGMWMRLGDLQLHLLENAEVPNPFPGLPHLALHVDGGLWDATIEELSARGVEFLFPPSTRTDFGVQVRAVFVRDPAGNVLELTDVGPLASR